MINIKKLTEKDIGRKVICSTCKGIENFGRIKTWDDRLIYVIYDDWGCSEGFISEPVYPQYLTFEKGGEIMELKEIEEIIGLAIGEGSMCWSETPKGIFDSENAKRITEETALKILNLKG